MGQYHIIGAGLAGLASAVKSISDYGIKGSDIHLYEAAPQAGGRCRSFEDAKLGCEIDNGNHLMLSGNYCVMEYLEVIGASDEIMGPSRAVFPFLDLADGKRWDIEFNPSALPFWIFNKKARVPDAGVRDHLALLKLMRADDRQTLDQFIARDNPLYERLIDPLSVAVVNMTPETASAKLMKNVLLETALKGGTACQPRIARHSLAQTLVDPAMSYLKAQGVNIHMGERLKSLAFKNQSVGDLAFTGRHVLLSPEDKVILALPPGPASQVLETINLPLDYSAIVNLHFKLDDEINVDWPAPLIGLIGGTAQWVFVRGSLASVTISAGNDLLSHTSEELAQTVWGEIADLFGIAETPVPPYRVIKEKRATLAQSPELEPHRPAAQTSYDNLYLAGDWTDTGLPATIEGAIRSGYIAAKAIQNSKAKRPKEKVRA